MFRQNSIQKLLRQRLFVTVKVGHNFSGVLIHSDRQRDGQHVFADVKIHLPDSGPEPAVGEVYVDRANVAYVQKLPPNANS